MRKCDAVRKPLRRGSQAWKWSEETAIFTVSKLRMKRRMEGTLPRWHNAYPKCPQILQEQGTSGNLFAAGLSDGQGWLRRILKNVGEDFETLFELVTAVRRPQADSDGVRRGSQTTCDESF